MAENSARMHTEVDGVKTVAFSVLSADEIRDRAACEVTNLELFSNGAPVHGGLYDTRMGVTEFGQRCSTCHRCNKECIGHPGYIELAVPLFNPTFLEPYVKKILRCVCLRCSAACFPATYVPRSTTGESALSHAVEESGKVRDCPACSAPRPERLWWNKQVALASFCYQMRNDPEQLDLSSTQVYEILGKISSEDCRLMGLCPDRSRPENLMFKALPVPPIAVRPAHRSGGQRRDDDITQKLAEIIKSNRALRNKMEADIPEAEVTRRINYIQLDVIHLIENPGNGIHQARTKATNRPLKSIVSRLRGKEGRVRNNLLGKRVDFSARSVISAEPNISVEEVGVPVRIAMTLTFPEVVHATNIDRLRQAVANGPDAYPGARLLRQNGTVYSLERAERRVRTDLNAGDIVERHMIDGDVVLVNRQPSLHRMSMMCHRVRVMPYDTIRLNVLVTEAYNADFDGDEMNIFLPQSASTAYEISSLASVRSQIVSPRYHRPIIGVVQDVALGLFLMTQEGVHVDERTAANICARFATDMPTRALTGKELFSSMLPDDLHCQMKNARIEHGQLVHGSVGKIQFQEEGSGVLHSVFAEDGEAAAVKLLDNAQAMTCDWLIHNGHSMGARDIVLSDSGRQRISEICDEAVAAVDDILKEVHAGKFVNNSTRGDLEELEDRITSSLESAHGEIIKIAVGEGLDEGTRLMRMVRAKSKGNDKNVVQMAGILGQNFIDNARMPLALGDRAMPHFHRHDIRANARGFIRSCFRDGLAPHEFFFHAMAGREGLIDTAVKTADVGYMQRRFVKALEDLQVASDGSVRDASHAVVSARYGGDGMDACAVETQTVPTFGGDLQWLAENYLISRTDEEEMRISFTPTAQRAWTSMGASGLEVLAQHFREVVEDKHFLAKCMRLTGDALGEGQVAAAIGHERIIKRIGCAHNPDEVISDLDITEVLRQMDLLTQELFPIDQVVQARGSGRPAKQRALGAALLRAHLSPKPLIRRGITRSAFEKVLACIRHRHYTGLASVSSMVGITAAQSIAEPSTQMVLNSVVWSTELLISIDGVLTKTTIGALTDDYMERTKGTSDHEVHPNDTHLAWIKDRDVRIGSVDEDGRAHWTRVEACTRHPVVNEDGSDLVYKVTLKCGAEITVTRGKGLLKRVDNKLVHATIDDFKVGDYLPMAATLQPDVPEIDTLDMMDWVMPTKAVFMSEANKAIARYHQDRRGELEHVPSDQPKERNPSWWRTGQGRVFQLPFNRCDSFMASFGVGDQCRNSRDRREGCVYPSNFKNGGHIPERIPMDADLGFFFGAYLAEGHAVKRVTTSRNGDECVSHVAVIISNDDPQYLTRVKNLLAKWEVTYHGVNHETGRTERGAERGIRITSTVLGEMFAEACGVLSHNKRMPAQFLQAPESFRKGLIDGYFSGDGSVNIRAIAASSVSRTLLKDIQAVLLTFGIRNRCITEHTTAVARAARKGLKGRRCWGMRLNLYDAHAFAKTFTLIIPKKQAALDALAARTVATRFDDIIPDMCLRRKPPVHMEVCDIQRMLAEDRYGDKPLSVHDKAVLVRTLREQTWFSQIVSIEATKPPPEHPLMYDLTVELTRNFNGFDTVAYSDSFHNSGSIGAHKASVPRVKELVNCSKTPRLTEYNVQLLRGTDTSERFATAVRDRILCTHVRDVVARSQTLCENGATSCANDERLHRLSRVFAPSDDANDDPRFVLRLEVDRDRMLEHGVAMLELYAAIAARVYADIVTSDDAADELAVRITPHISRMNGEDLISELRELESCVLDTRIKGVTGISKCIVQSKKDKGAKEYDRVAADYRSRDHYSLVAVAGPDAAVDAMYEILAIDGVDTVASTLDNLTHVYALFGIEAARSVLLSELQKAYASDTYSDFRHIELLVDFMTRRGQLTAITRHGIGATDAGPLVKCSFEQTVQQLARAAVFGETDSMTGVSSNIMFGQTTPCGTGGSEIIVDVGACAALPEGETVDVRSVTDSVQGVVMDLQSMIRFSYKQEACNGPIPVIAFLEAGSEVPSIPPPLPPLVPFAGLRENTVVGGTAAKVTSAGDVHVDFT